MEEIKRPLKVRQLTHLNANGEPYERTPEVEAQIRAVLGMEPSVMLERARISDRKSQNFLKEESLVYLIKEYQLLGDDITAGALSEILLKRCTHSIKNNFLSLNENLAEEAFEETFGAIYDKIIDVESDRGDFLEVRFWHALKRQAITTFHEYEIKQDQADRTVEIGEPGLDSFEEDYSIAGRSVDPPAPDPSEEQRSACRDGLRQLNANERTAYILVYLHGWPIESQKKGEPTVSGFFKKDPRTIRNWLASAEKKLRAWREGVK